MSCGFICCDGASSINDLFLILESEINSGEASPIPGWYVFKHACKRGFGCHVCSARGCFASETMNKRFGSCIGCRVAYYCSVNCQTKDWKERHKFICAEAKRIVGKDGEAEYYLKLLKDPNIQALLERKGSSFHFKGLEIR